MLSALPGPVGGKYRNIITQVNMDFLPPPGPPSPHLPPGVCTDCCCECYQVLLSTPYVGVFSVDSSVFRTRAEITVCLPVQNTDVIIACHLNKKNLLLHLIQTNCHILYI